MTAPTTITFEQRGVFAASAAAEAWLIARGFSIGAIQASHPRAILYGPERRVVATWSHLTEANRRELDGQIDGDHGNGPITVTIFARAPAAARVAVSRAA